jgi:enamine deaminase RidA (YjgF/YER057c/UK114 family)
MVFKESLSGSRFDSKNVVSQTVFASQSSIGSLRADSPRLFGEFYGGWENTPSTGIVGQRPVNGGVGFEAVLVLPKKGFSMLINAGVTDSPGRTHNPPKRLNASDTERLLDLPAGTHEDSEDVVYSTVFVDGKKWVYASGLSGNPSQKTAKEHSKTAIAKEMAILIREGVFTPGKIVQAGLINSKHYLHDIVGSNYNEFNVERDLAYRKIGLVRDYPSATGIGMFTDSGEVIIEMTAAKGVDYEPVTVARHGEAHQYSLKWLSGQAVGGLVGAKRPGIRVATPKFSRAIYLPKEKIMIISGTASVEAGTGIQYGIKDFQTENKDGMGVNVDITPMAESIGVQELKKTSLDIIADPNGKIFAKAKTPALAQTIVTLRNMARLLNAKDMSLKDLAQARVYLKDINQHGEVMPTIKELTGNTPALCVEGPVCYDEMLVEIEGIAGKTHP